MIKAELLEQIQFYKQLLVYTGNGILDSGFKVDSRMTKAQLEELYQQLQQMASA